MKASLETGWLFIVALTDVSKLSLVSGANPMNMFKNEAVPERTKIYFEFFNDILDQDYVESIWASVEEEGKGIYKIDNIPFFAKGYSCGDLVYANEQDGRLVVQSLVKESGNSTIQVICFKPKLTDQIRQVLEQLGCEWEGSHLPNYFAVNVPVSLIYQPIKEYLSEQEVNGILGFREACLAHK